MRRVNSIIVTVALLGLGVVASARAGSYAISYNNIFEFSITGSQGSSSLLQSRCQKVQLPSRRPSLSSCPPRWIPLPLTLGLPWALRIIPSLRSERPANTQGVMR